CGVDDYDAARAFLRPRRFFAPASDSFDVVGMQAWAAGEADDGVPAAFRGFPRPRTSSTRPLSDSRRAWLGLTLKRSPGRRVPECSKDSSARTSIMGHHLTNGAAHAAPLSSAVGWSRSGGRQAREVALHERGRPVDGERQALLDQQLDHVLDEVAVVLRGDREADVLAVPALDG